MKTWQRFDPNRWCKTWAPDVIRGPFSESSADMFQRVLNWLFNRGLGLDELAKRLDVRQEPDANAFRLIIENKNLKMFCRYQVLN